MKKSNKSDGVKLRYVVVNGKLHHVEDFAGLRPHDRPDAQCPVCGMPVVLKLGNEREHHYAHWAGVSCPATNPETSLHVNCKFHVAMQLRRTRSITLANRCVVCGESHVDNWPVEWDAVHVEYTGNDDSRYRPDVALLKAGQMVAAVEIKVSHATEDAKSAWYESNQITWVEVMGTEALYEGESRWKSNQPLPVMRRDGKDWICPKCNKKSTQRTSQTGPACISDKDGKPKVEVFEHKTSPGTADRSRRKPPVKMFARMVDFYYPSGKKYRESFIIQG